MASLPRIAGFRLNRLIAEGPKSKLYAATIDSPGGRYQLVGESPSGRVFAGEALTHGQTCVVRVFDRESVSAESLSEFIQRRRAVAACRGVGCSEFIASDTGGRWPFVAMAEAPGETLESLGKAGLTVEEVCEIAGSVCTRLAALHEGGFVHGALMPSTIKVWRVQGALQVSLLGIGGHLLRPPGDDFTVVLSHDPVADYMAPELLVGSVSSPTPACDLYALGIILFEALVGHGPFRRSRGQRVNQRLRSAPPRLREEMRASVPDAIDTVVSHLLSRDPSGRPSSARQLGAELSAVFDDDEATVVFVSPAPPGQGEEGAGQTVALSPRAGNANQKGGDTVILAGETMVPGSGVTVLPEAFRGGAPEFLESTTIVP
ncbi:MAG TPA: hypothetical protein ENJ18_14655, partial [Nannocystis exedens]|nr:hypothetical protein [Nannocystis exedens]